MVRIQFKYRYILGLLEVSMVFFLAKNSNLLTKSFENRLTHPPKFPNFQKIPFFQQLLKSFEE